MPEAKVDESTLRLLSTDIKDVLRTVSELLKLGKDYDINKQLPFVVALRVAYEIARRELLRTTSEVLVDTRKNEDKYMIMKQVHKQFRPDIDFDNYLNMKTPELEGVINNVTSLMYGMTMNVIEQGEFDISVERLNNKQTNAK